MSYMVDDKHITVIIEGCLVQKYQHMLIKECAVYMRVHVCVF